ncbi:uncharacterized protein LOC120342656 isoform X1 [Styela clava]
MVKIGRPVKNYGLTKVQARKLAKDGGSIQKHLNKILMEDKKSKNEESIGRNSEFLMDNHGDSCRALAIRPREEIGQGEPCGVLMTQTASPKTITGTEVVPAKSTCGGNLPAPKYSSAISYPDLLERAIAEAEIVVGKWILVTSKQKYPASNKSSMASVANALKFHLQEALESTRNIRYTELQLIMAKKKSKRGFKSPNNLGLSFVRHTVDTNPELMVRMTHAIIYATNRLKQELHWVSNGRVCNKNTTKCDFLPIPPLVLDLRLARSAISTNLKSTAIKVDISIVQRECIASTELKLPGISSAVLEFDVKAIDDESPRERLQRKMSEHGFDQKEGNKSKNTENLTVIVASVLQAIQKKSRREMYEVMPRTERRTAMRHDLIVRLRPNFLLPKLIRHIHTGLPLHIAGIPRDMEDLIMTSVALNGKQHVLLFVKNVAAEFLGSDLEAFRARQQYYFMWSCLFNKTRAKLFNTWLKFTLIFSSGSDQIDSVILRAREDCRCTVERILNKFQLLIRRNKPDKNRSDVVKILQRYFRKVEKTFEQYGKTIAGNILSGLANEVETQTTNSTRQPHRNMQMRMMVAASGFQHLQSRLFHMADDIIRKAEMRSSPDEKLFITSIKSLIFMVIQRSTIKIVRSMGEMFKQQMCVKEYSENSNEIVNDNIDN